MPSKTSGTFTYALLCNLPILLIITVASLDHAYKQLLSSSFPILERNLYLDVKTLGYFSLFSDLSYALSVPFWGYLVHKYGLAKLFMLLSITCASWGVSTMGIAVAESSIVGKAVMRSINGWMLGSILPLSQTLLVQLVPPSMRGRGFGIMAVSEKLAGTVASTSVVYWEENWEVPYYCLCFISVLMSWLVFYHILDPSRRAYLRDSNTHVGIEGGKKKSREVKFTLGQIIKRIVKLPVFRCLVAQGVFGATPWSMMSFQLLLLEWREFTKDQIIYIQLTSELSGTLGAWIGGMLGDYAAKVYSNPTKGRITIALFSVLGGIPAYGMFLYSKDYVMALIFINLFHLVAPWTPPAAIRPICADLTRNPSESSDCLHVVNSGKGFCCNFWCSPCGLFD